MKRCILGLVLGLGVALLTVGAQPPSVALAGDDPRYCDKEGDIHNSSHSDWMKWLPDDMNLTDLSLPGTHDTLSRNVVVYAETQAATLKRQLDAGIRVLDIRAKHNKDHFAIHHGSVHLGMFGVDVLVPVGEFLAAHPTETIVMRLGDAGVPDPEGPNDLEYHEVFEWYRDYTSGGTYIWRPPDPTSNPVFPDLGAVRGKIVILQDFTAPSYYGPRWPEEGTYVNDRFDIQDDYQIGCGDVDLKWHQVRRHLLKTNPGDSAKMYVNHLSAVGPVPIPPTPGQVACGSLLCGSTGVNEFTLAYLFEGNVRRTGALMMDFPGAGLIDAIIAHNMRYATSLLTLQSDFKTMFSNIAYSADNVDDGQDDEAYDRAIQLLDFLNHIVENNMWMVAVMRGEYGRGFSPYFSDNWPYGWQTADNYLHLAYRVESCSYFYPYERWGSLLALLAFSSSGSAQARADTLAKWLRDNAPRQNWTVLVKKEGGYKNWAYSYCSGLWYELPSADGYAFGVFGYKANYPPQANAGGPYTGQEGSAITFEGSGSSDPNADLLQYRWDFDNDGTWDTGWSNTSSASYTWSNQYSGTVKVEVRDEVDSKFPPPTSVDTAAVTVTNAPPEITQLDASPAAINENGWTDLDGVFTDPGEDESTVVIEWGDGTNDTLQLTGGEREFSAPHQYLDDNPTGTPSDDYAVTVTVTDDDGASDTAGTTVTVYNVDPEITATGDTIDENGEATVSGEIWDPGILDTFTVEIDWGEGDPPEPFSYPAGTTSYSETHQYLDDNPTGTPSDDYTVTVTVTDDDGGQDSDEVVVTVANVAPEITATGDTINEDGVATVSGEITDPGILDTFTVEIDWGEGAPETSSYPAGATSYSETHQYLDDNPTGTPSDVYPIGVSIQDDDGGPDHATTTVTVNNVDPVASIDGITDENGAQVGTDVDVVLTNTAVDVAASFTDAGTLDTHTATINWGDGNVDDLGGVTSPISAAHVYSDPCDCTITLTVTDDDTGVGPATAQIEVVDAAGGINDVIDDLTPYSDDRDVAKAIAKLRGEKGGHASNGALDMLEKDNLNAALKKIKQALEYLEAAEAADPSLDFTHQKGLLSLAAKSVAVAAIDQAEAAASGPKVQQARDLVAEGDALRLAGDFVDAVGKYEQAARKVQGIA